MRCAKQYQERKERKYAARREVRLEAKIKANHAATADNAMAVKDSAQLSRGDLAATVCSKETEPLDAERSKDGEEPLPC